jgi:hypothetical protein
VPKNKGGTGNVADLFPVIAEAIHVRHLAGGSMEESFEKVGPIMPELAAADLRSLASRSWS